MKRCWVHIGMHKTGTTSVQRSFEKQGNLDDWTYLTVGGSRNMGGALYAMFATHPHRYHWFLRRGDTPEQVAAEGVRLRTELAETIRACGNSNIIISGESLSLIDNDGIGRLRDFLHALCDEIRIIGYVRAPLGFKISFFQQRVKHSDCPFDFNDFSLNYRSRFRKFDTAFGRENVLLKKFDPPGFRNGCVVTDFCESIGLDMPEGFAAGRVNESLTREACGLLFAYQKYRPEQDVGWNVIKENNQIIAPLIEMRGTRFHVAQRLLELSPDEKEDLRWMEKRLGVSLREEFADDGTEVMDETDLLYIRKSACEEFALRFGEYHGIGIPVGKIPQQDPVDPRQVAQFIDFCRGLWREKDLRKKEARAEKAKKTAAAKRLRKRPPPLKRIWKYLKKAPARCWGALQAG